MPHEKAICKKHVADVSPCRRRDSAASRKTPSAQLGDRRPTHVARCTASVRRADKGYQLHQRLVAQRRAAPGCSITWGFETDERPRGDVEPLS